MRCYRYISVFLAVVLSYDYVSTPVMAQANSQVSKPNIIFILADDLGYADIGATGATDIHTPHIDSLAKNGTTFVNAYAGSAICSPTRTAILTGQYPQRFRVGLDEPLRSSDAKKYDLGIPKGQTTVASALRELGYETALVGKWHQGLLPKNGPLAHGYEHFFGIAQGAADYFRHTMVTKGKASSTGLYSNNKEVTREGYLTDILGDEAVRRIHAADDRPLFLSLHFTAPHWPWQGREDEQVSEALEFTWHYDGGDLATYKAMVEVMDENIGKVLHALEQTSLAENSIVIFTNDNGGERFSNTWPFTGVKAELLEGGIRVPLIIRWPDKVPGNRRSDQIITSMDFLPTLLAAAGAQNTDDKFDGMNLLPQLLGVASPVKRTLFWRFKAGSQAAVRRGDWKYLRLGSKEHLFNVASDPRERVLLHNKHPEIFAELRELYELWNRDMLPYPEESYSESVKNSYPDRY